MRALSSTPAGKGHSEKRKCSKACPKISGKDIGICFKKINIGIIGGLASSNLANLRNIGNLPSNFAPIEDGNEKAPKLTSAPSIS